MKIIPKWVVRAITLLKKSKLSKHITIVHAHHSHVSSSHPVASKYISEHTKPSQHRRPHYHTGLVFEDEGEDENGNMLGDASPLHAYTRPLVIPAAGKETFIA
jgi:hypothetical protein